MARRGASAAAGAAAAADLFRAGDPARWRQHLESYDAAIARLSASRSPLAGSADLLTLDRWLRNDWPGEAGARGLTREALSKIAAWKLSRGQFRPLLPRIRSNDEAAVKGAWKAAVAARDKAAGCGQGAAAKAIILPLTKLDGVGPATASAIMAPHLEGVPFMSDEAMEACGCPLKYDMKTYEVMVERLSAKAAALGTGWTAECVGRALWACAALGGTASAGTAEVQSAAVKRPAASLGTEKSVRRRVD